jgi:hypothetical protein
LVPIQFRNPFRIRLAAFFPLTLGHERPQDLGDVRGVREKAVEVPKDAITQGPGIRALWIKAFVRRSSAVYFAKGVQGEATLNLELTEEYHCRL